MWHFQDIFLTQCLNKCDQNHLGLTCRTPKSVGLGWSSGRKKQVCWFRCQIYICSGYSASVLLWRKIICFLVTRAKLFLSKWRGERRFPGGSVVKNPPGSPGATKDMGLIPGSGSSPGEGNANHSRLLSGKLLGQRNLVGYSPWGCKESDMTERLSRQRDRIQKISVHYNCHITVLHALPINSCYINKCIFITSKMLINMVKF